MRGAPGDRPVLKPVGSGRSARAAAITALVVLGTAVAVALVDRLPSDARPRPSPLAIASPTADRSAAAPSASTSPAATAAVTQPAGPEPPSALDRGNGWPPDAGRPETPFFDIVLLSQRRTIDQARLDGTPAAVSGRMAITPDVWHRAPRLQIRWSDGRPDGQPQQLAIIRLGARRLAPPSSPTRLGLPVELAAGRALLAEPMMGTRHWSYELQLERADDYSEPDEWVASVRLAATEPQPLPPPSRAAPLILLTATPDHPRRASRIHGASWVAGR